MLVPRRSTAMSAVMRPGAWYSAGGEPLRRSAGATPTFVLWRRAACPRGCPFSVAWPAVQNEEADARGFRREGRERRGGKGGGKRAVGEEGGEVDYAEAGGGLAGHLEAGEAPAPTLPRRTGRGGKTALIQINRHK